MILPILIHPNPILRTAAVPINEVDNEIRQFTHDMMETMREAQGIGLAAPQIGESIRLIIATDGQQSTLVMVNPKIKRKSFFKDIMEEGCLSIPNVSVQVKRHKSLTVQYTDLENRTQTLSAKGFLARVIQHEIDHLDGILIIDKIFNS